MSKKQETTTIEEYTLKNGETRFRSRIYVGIDSVTGGEIRTTVTGKTKRELKQKIIKIKSDFANGTYKKKQITTYQEVYDLWIKVYEKTVEESTFVKTLGIFRNHILPAMGAYKIDKINVGICQRHVDEWMEKLVNGDKTKSYASIVMRFAIKRDYIQSNPFDLVDLPRQRKKSSTKRETENFYTKEQLRSFLECAENQPNYKVYAFFRLLAYSGMRKGEALALNWEDINFKENEISINKAVGQGVSQRLYIKPTKTNTKRTIKMDEATMIVLKEWKKKQQQAYLMLGYNTLQKNQLVFSNTKNSFIQPTKTNDWLKSIISKNNLPTISTHGFRHTHCSLLFEAGATIKSVQDRLGHTDVKTTMDVYTHVTSTAKEDAIIKFTNHLK